MRIFALCALALLATTSPASAKGKHISCQFKVVINNGTKGGDTSTERTMNFYLDDTHAQLVGEGGDFARMTNLNVRTTTYSDTEIDAEVTTGMENGMMFFGEVIENHVDLKINRVTGVAAYGVRLLPRGAELGMGPCREIAPPGAKF